MELRTKIEKPQAKEKISYNSSVLFIGSCFADDIGRQFLNGKMQVSINPFGVLYNPMSSARALELIMKGKLFRKEELHFFDNKFLSFYHDTSFSSGNHEKSLRKINNSVSDAHVFLKTASHLFITFGTAWVYRWKENNEIVANCHKIPAARFTRHLLNPEDIVSHWTKIVASLAGFNNNLNIAFTVSPVRHLKDGAHGNQVSKSTLVVAIEELISANDNLSYFPSYEIMLDELRDYRFYDKDMIHPSDTAVEYIWERFKETYFAADTSAVYDQVSKISEATRHIIISEEKEDILRFKKSMLEKITQIRNNYPFINLDEEESYFKNLSAD